MRILLVEDDRTQREEMFLTLRTLGYEDAAVVASGEDALEVLDKEDFDLVILDLLLPGVQGNEVCRAIRGSPRNCGNYVLAITVQEDGAAFQAIMDAGADDYLIKPASINQLRVRLLLARRFLEGARLAREFEGDKAQTAAALRRAMDKLQRRNERIHKINEALRREIEAKVFLEKALTNAKEYFSKLFHLCPDPIAITRPQDGAVVDCNEAAIRLMGMSKEELLNKTTVGFLNWQHREEKINLLRDLAERGEALEREASFVTRQGKLFHALISARVMSLGGEDCVLYIAHDITARKKAEEKMRKALEDKEKLNRLMSGREKRVLELKQEVNELRAELGLPAEYRATI